MSYGQQPYGTPTYGQNPYGQNPYQQNPYGQNPYAQPPSPYPSQPGYGQAPTPKPPQSFPSQTSASATPPLQTPVPAPATRKVALATHEILCVTTDLVPGRDIAAALGEVVGVVVRPSLSGADRAALLTEQRQAAVSAAVTMAVDAEADAIVGLRFETSLLDAAAEAEIVAYGTAVKLAPLAAEPSANVSAASMMQAVPPVTGGHSPTASLP